MTAVARYLTQVGHLARRFVRALSQRPPADADESWATQFLLPGECALWTTLNHADRRHSIEVARRFAAAMGESPRDDMAAVLLHDVGKLASGLGTWARVAATVLGPRTRRFRLYHDHEMLGAEMARKAGSTGETIALLCGTSDRANVLAALRRADDV